MLFKPFCYGMAILVDMAVNVNYYYWTQIQTAVSWHVAYTTVTLYSF